MQGNVSSMALCVVVNINLCLAERSVAMVIVAFCLVKNQDYIQTGLSLIIWKGFELDTTMSEV